MPDANIKFVGEAKGPIVSDSHFLKLVADYEISEIESADLLLIPGSVIGFLREAKKEHVKDWIGTIRERREDHYFPGRIRRDRYELIPGVSNRRR
jgi:hypothetical protein